VLYLHAGLFDEAAAELGAYFRHAARGPLGGRREDPFDLRLTKLLLEFIQSGGQSGGSGGTLDALGGGLSGADGGAAGGGDAEGSAAAAAARRQTLLAPRAAGAAPAFGQAAEAEGAVGVGTGGGSSSGGRGGGAARGAFAAQLMSVEKVLAAAEAGASGGLLGAAAPKLPLTW
jgi:hypothetical protein